MSMTTLRVLLAEAPSAARDDAWALFDAAGRNIGSGRDAAEAWPAADRREAVLAASAVRLLALTLPPMPVDRVPAACAFALEDHLAGPVDAYALACGPPAPDGTVLATIAPKALTTSLRAQFARVVAEPALVPIPPPSQWSWYASAAGGGFVRKPDGSAFATSPIVGTQIAPELAVALREAGRTGGMPRGVSFAFEVGDVDLDAWTITHRVQFSAAARWRWDADGTAITAAPALAAPDTADVPHAAPWHRGLRRAAAVILAAAALHVAATTVQWAWLHLDAWRTAHAVQEVAREVGVGETHDAAAAAAALAGKFTDARHRAGKTAPTDALPLLARAAGPLAVLPAGTLRNAIYAQGSWTFDLKLLDATTLAGLEEGFATAGLATLHAPAAGGTRARVTLAPGMDLP